MTDSGGISPIIHVKNARKNYGSHPVLLGVDVLVEPGTIYGLLGPSGCGKTTLINCIVGRSELDSGSISFDLGSHKDIGFMPQEISLYLILSIDEVLRFYGYLFGMQTTDIKRRAKYIADMLDLPPLDSCVSNLSGGQQRRVSLAVALLHDPKVLILDEPTVGLDPVLSKNLWDWLRKMSSQGKTVVLTTHYIEEARQANTIGMMREGTMLAEDSPGALLKRYRADYLEDVFLSLCTQDNNNIVSSKVISTKRPTFFETRTFDKSDKISLARVKAQVWKNFCVAKRNLVMTIFSLVLPVVLNVCVKLDLGSDPYYLPLAIVNHEFKDSVQRCPRTFTNSCILENDLMIASCVFINELRDRDYQMAEYLSFEEALLDHHKKRNRGIVMFTNNFTRALSQRILGGMSGASDVVITNSVINVLLDSTDYAVHKTMTKDLTDATSKMMQLTVETCIKLVQPGSLQPSLQFQDPVYGDKSWSFFVYFMTAFNVLNVVSNCIIFTSAAILDEKQQGSLDRILCTGANMLEIMISHVIMHSCSVVIYSVQLYLLTYHVFDQPLVGSPILLIAVFLVTGLTGVFIGLAVGLLADHLITTANAAAGCIFGFVCATGLLWPLEGAHKSIRDILPFMPITSTITLTREIALKGHDLTHPAVVKGMIHAVIWLIASLVFGIVVIKTRKGSWNTKR